MRAAMTTQLSAALLATVAIHSAAAQVQPASVTTALDRFLTQHLADIPNPGFSAVVVQNGRVIFQKGYGVEVAGGRTPLTARSPIAIGSQTKSFTAVAIMKLVEDGEGMLLKNRIFIDRLENVGKISQKDAIALSWTGPCLRSTGCSYDVRKAHPYLKYDEVDFDVPVGTQGDNMDRFLVRLGELRQSMRIILQCCNRMADEGPVSVDDPRVMLPPKQES